MALSRRQFFKVGLSGGAAGLLFGFDIKPALAQSRGLKIARTTETHSICPYCAVSCGVIIHTLGDKAKNVTPQVVHVEGDPDDPINRGTLCPKGAATYQLAVNPLRMTKVWYRAPGATEWDKTKTLDWAMERIAQLTKKTRDQTFQESWEIKDKDGKAVKKRVNNTLAIASLGGATMDNEWNYVQCKLMRALGVVFLENQARI